MDQKPDRERLIKTPEEREASAASASPRLSRRFFLKSSGAAVATGAGVVAARHPPFAMAYEGDEPPLVPVEGAPAFVWVLSSSRGPRRMPAARHAGIRRGGSGTAVW